jgi:hypothetical protein
LIVASDGGLLFPALRDAWNPTRTRRFAGSGATDQDRAAALLALAAHLTGPDRTIGWRESLALARDGRLLRQWSAESPPGILATRAEPALIAAGHGFWLPALWLSPDHDNRPLAPLTPAERAARPDHWYHLGTALREALASSQ